MNATIEAAVGQAHLRSAWNGWRQEQRMRVTTWLSMTLVVGLATVICLWLLYEFEQRQIDKNALSLHNGLWLAILITWVGIGFFTVFGALRAGFGSAEAQFLFTLPIAPAVHFRILFGLVLVEQTGALLALLILGYGLAFFLALGTWGFVWLLILLLGTAVVVWFVLLATIAFVRYGLPRLRRLLWPLLLGGIGVEGITLLLSTERIWEEENQFLLSPITILLVLSSFLGVGLGPLAGWAGRHYMVAFQMLEGYGQSRRAFTFPGLPHLLAVIGRRRSLTAGLIVRSVLEQNRHPLALPRLAVLPVYLLIFAVLRPRLLALGFSEPGAAAATGAVMGGLLLIEYGLAYALSGEGARLAIYLTAPLHSENLLRAKLVAVLPPVMLIGWATLAITGMGTGLSIAEWFLAISTTTLLLVGVTGFVVWAGAGDVDLDALPHGSTELLLQEELPVTPRRLQLLGIGFLVLVAAIYLLWRLPLLQVLALALLLCGFMLWMGWRLGVTGLRDLLT
jgi:hypothetical protein